MTSADRRQEPRYPTNLAVRYRFIEDGSDAGPWHCGIMLSASESGLFLRAPVPQKTGSPCEVELPMHDGLLLVPSAVAWISHESPVGFGLEFNNADDDFRQHLHEEILSGRWLKDGAAHNPSTASHSTGDLSDLFGADNE